MSQQAQEQARIVFSNDLAVVVNSSASEVAEALESGAAVVAFQGQGRRVYVNASQVCYVEERPAEGQQQTPATPTAGPRRYQPL